MKKYMLLLGIIFVMFSTTSCTVLQWRKSDLEINKKFETLKIPNEISYYQVDSLGLKIRIQSVWNQKNKVNLIFFHGAPSSLSTWESYVTDSSLIANSNMHAIDRPGYGYSGFGKELTSINAQAQLMSNIINDKKLDHIIAIGSSYGGPIAARVAVLNEKVKAVVMISPAIDPSIEKEVWASRLTQWKLTRWLVPTGYRVAGDEKTVHAQELELIEKDWKTVTIPVLHIHGDVDDLVPYENMYYSKKHFKNIEIVSFTGKGHEVAWTDAPAIIPHILKLIHLVKNQ